MKYKCLFDHNSIFKADFYLITGFPTSYQIHDGSYNQQ